VCELRAQVVTSVHVCALALSLVCVLLFSPLHLCFFVIINCKGERLQVVEIPRERDIVKGGGPRGEGKVGHDPLKFL
jgi:hypothetical protein